MSDDPNKDELNEETEDLGDEGPTDEELREKYDIKPPELDEKPAATDTPDAAEERTEKDDTADEAPEPEAKTEPVAPSGDAPVIDQELYQRGLAREFSREEMASLGADRLRSILTRLENKELQAQLDAAKPKAPDEPVIDLSKMEMDDEAKQLFQAMFEKTESLTRQVKDLSQGVEQDKAVQEKREAIAQTTRFDKRLQAVGRDDVYGKAPNSSRMDVASPEYTARNKLWTAQKFFETQGLSEEESFESAVRAQHATDYKREAVKEIADTINTGSKQAISKPSSGKDSKPKTGYEKAMETEREWRRAHGWEPIADDEEIRF